MYALWVSRRAGQVSVGCSLRHPKAFLAEMEPEVQSFGHAVRSEVVDVTAVLRNHLPGECPLADRADGGLAQAEAAISGMGQHAEIHEPRAGISAGGRDELVAGKAPGRDLVIHFDITFIDIFRRARLVEQGHRSGVCGRQLPKCEGWGCWAGLVIGREEVVHQAGVAGCDRPSAPRALEIIARERGAGRMLRQHAADLIGVGRVELDERVLADIPEGNELLAGVSLKRTERSCRGGWSVSTGQPKWAAQLR